MSRDSRWRRLPPVCILAAAVLALLGRLRLERRYVGSVLVMEDGTRFRVFRHLSLRDRTQKPPASPALFVVRFRFARLSRNLNRRLSLVPLPLIGGHPGFRHKLWMVDEETGSWQGVYEWESTAAVEAYRRSFVFRVMSRRAAPGSVSQTTIPQTRLADYANRLTASASGSPG